MKHSLVIIFSLLFFSASSASGDKDTSKPNSPAAESTNGNNNPYPTGNKIKIKIGPSTFTATLYDNATATAFKALLPLTINMQDLNSNEKYFDLPASLPTNASNPGTIQNGDLMMYDSKTLVLFYESFSTSYNYTKLGRIKDTTGLAAAVGSGNVTVTYKLE